MAIDACVIKDERSGIELEERHLIMEEDTVFPKRSYDRSSPGFIPHRSYLSFRSSEVILRTTEKEESHMMAEKGVEQKPSNTQRYKNICVLGHFTLTASEGAKGADIPITHHNKVIRCPHLVEESEFTIHY